MNCENEETCGTSRLLLDVSDLKWSSLTLQVLLTSPLLCSPTHVIMLQWIKYA